MKKFFVSMLDSIRRILQCRARKQAVAPPLITPEQFRELFAQMMTDPQSRNLFMRKVVLHGPVMGATGCPGVSGPSGGGTTNKLVKWTDTTCDVGDSAVFESGGNVGIATTSPGVVLQVNSAVTSGPATRILQTSSSGFINDVLQSKTVQAAGSTFNLLTLATGAHADGTGVPQPTALTTRLWASA